MRRSLVDPTCRSGAGLGERFSEAFSSARRMQDIESDTG